jgi:hypothetical protein
VIADAELTLIEPERRAAVVLDELHAQSTAWQRTNRRPRGLSAREALAALQFEAMVVWSAAHSLRDGLGLSDEDRARLTLAMQRIDALTDEAIA